MVQRCGVCQREATTNDDRYYEVRTTATGRDFAEDLRDRVLCLSCLNEYLSTYGAQQVQSILRIENPRTEDAL